MKQIIHIWTDGSVYEGVGGWAVRVIHFKGHDAHRITDQQGEITDDPVSSRQSEMIAIIAGLHLLRNPAVVTIHTDDRHMNRDWERFKENGSAHSCNELWNEMLKATVGHKIAWNYVKGHNGNEHNESCHRRAGRAAYGAWESREARKKS